MNIFWLLVGIIIGLFIPSPVDATIKNWFKSMWNKIRSLWKKESADEDNIETGL